MGTILFLDLMPRIPYPVSRSKRHSLAMLYKNKGVSSSVPNELKTVSSRKKAVTGFQRARVRKIAGGKYEG